MILGTLALGAYACLFLKHETALRNLARELAGSSLRTLRRRSSFGGKKGRAAQHRIRALESFALSVMRNSDRLRPRHWLWQRDAPTAMASASLTTEARRLASPHWYRALHGPDLTPDIKQLWVLNVPPIERIESTFRDLARKYARFFVLLALGQLYSSDRAIAGDKSP